MRCEKVTALINLIKIYNLVTDIGITYNMDRENFIVMDRIDKKLIRGIKLDLKEFHDFINELNKLSLWDSDYELEFKINKY